MPIASARPFLPNPASVLSRVIFAPISFGSSCRLNTLDFPMLVSFSTQFAVQVP